MRKSKPQLLAICFLLLILGLTLSSTSNNLKLEESKNTEPAKLEELIIGLENISNASWQILEDLVHAHNARIKDIIHFGNKIEAIVVRLPQSNSESFINSIKRYLQPTYIEYNVAYKACFVPDDQYWSLQWGPRKIEADYAWNITLGNSSILVAIVDTGIDWNHPDLSANYVPLGYDWVNDDSDPSDDNGHGTHVAGIVAAVINNSIGVAGLSQVKIMAEKALNETGYGNTYDLADAITHAVDEGAKIIIMSWGSDSPSILIHNAIKYAYRAGALLVAAAGNDATSNEFYPAAWSEVIAVSATDKNDNLASFSNFGDWIELAAPGVNIFSTIPDDSYAYMSGTSMAAPFVAGVAALTWSTYPELTRDELRSHLHATADDLGQEGFDIYFGYGRINARKAVENSTNSENATIVYVEPQEINMLRVGDSFSINITVSNVIDLHSWEFKLYYNSSMLNATSILEGPFLKQAGDTNFQILAFTDSYNASHGLIWTKCTLINASSGVNGNGTLAIINFRATWPGESPLSLADTLLLDSNNKTIQHTAMDGSVKILLLDIAITNITFSDSNQLVNEPINIHINIENIGETIETFNLTVKCAGPTEYIIGIQNVTLASNEATLLNFTWTPLTAGNYKIEAYINPIPGDINPDNNIKTAYIHIDSPQTLNQTGGGKIKLLLY